MRLHRFHMAVITLVTAGLSVPGAGAGQTSAPDLSDAQIAHIAVTANAIDVELAELARERGSGAEVVEFARRMITDHTAVNERAASLAERLGVTPEDNGVSRSLREGAAAAKRSLATVRGAAFDRAYLDREVEYHRAVLEALGGTLIPSTTNDELRSLLAEARGAVAAHLSHAEDLRARLGDGR